MSWRRRSAAEAPPPLPIPEWNAMLRAHEAFVTGRPGGARLLPRYVVARGMEAAGRKLADADFTGADLAGTDFACSDLSRAAFYCANLTGCDFTQARLDRADLRGCVLGGARLAGASLDGADMRSAVLCASDPLVGLRWIAGSALERLRQNARGQDGAFAVDFTDCSLRGARLRNANLKNADFSNAILEGADLTGARLDGCIFHGAVLTGVDLRGLNPQGPAFAGCVFDPTAEARALAPRIREAVDANHAWVETNGAAGRPAELDGMDLRPAGAAFVERFLARMSARGAQAAGLDFSKALLAGARLDGADLRGCDFRGADLRGVSLADANLAHARFDGARLGPLPLSGGRVQPLRLEGARTAGTGLARPPAAAVAPPALAEWTVD